MGIIAQAQVEIRWPQCQSVPLKGHYDVFADGNFNTPLNPAPLAAWPDGEGWRGFGMGMFGAGLFGLGEVALLFGKYRFGMGRFGLGAEMMKFDTPELADGLHTLTVVGFDAAGNPSAPSAGTDVAVTVAGTPAPPGAATADSYDSGTDTLTLSFAISGDDEA